MLLLLLLQQPPCRISAGWLECSMPCNVFSLHLRFLRDVWKCKDRQQTLSHRLTKGRLDFLRLRGKTNSRRTLGCCSVILFLLYIVTCSVSCLWVTYCFSWASRSLTSASRLLTSMTSSSSSSCSRLFWASVFCQSATTQEEQTPSERETLRMLYFYSKIHFVSWMKSSCFTLPGPADV